MLREKYVQIVDYVMEQLNTGGYGEMSLSTKQVLMKVATKCQNLADEESEKLAVEQPKLITKNPYSDNANPLHSAWAEGFEAGQKSTLTPLSVTGRWWQACNGKLLFAYPEEYDGIQLAVDNYPDLCRWLSNEETREFE